MNDTKEFRVPTWFFQSVADVPYKYQAVRTSLVVAMISAEPSECQDRPFAASAPCLLYTSPSPRD
eukprot:14459675-Alexandrium_andersonii.AAC.1